jgi:hypothetical protein
MDYALTLTSGYNGSEAVPFWIRSNQYGSVPPVGASLGLTTTVKKNYDPANQHGIAWGFSAEGRFNAGNPSNFILVEGVGKVRLGIFTFYAGRVKEITGICDTLLTSGSFSISGNALGIPKVQLSIPEFYTLPFLGQILAVKGSYAHGWIGDWYMENGRIPNTTPTYLHQTSLYGKLGKPGWKLKLYGGFNHQVVWGNEKKIMGEDYDLNTFQSFLYVNVAKLYNNDSIKSTRVGNSVGSIDVALEYNFKNVRLFVYRQNLYDAGALYYLANVLDGLNGISIINRKKITGNIGWKRFLIELLYTKNQAGEKWSKFTTSPFEDYYNNNYYEAGWSYKGVGMGTPFITPRGTTREGLPCANESYFINNRVAALHAAFSIETFDWDIMGRFSYSINYGTYRTSATGKEYEGSVYPSPNGVFPTVEQFSAFLGAGKELGKGLRIGFISAFDIGNLYYNTFGVMGSITKTL